MLISLALVPMAWLLSYQIAFGFCGLCLLFWAGFAIHALACFCRFLWTEKVALASFAAILAAGVAASQFDSGVRLEISRMVARTDYAISGIWKRAEPQPGLRIGTKITSGIARWANTELIVVPSCVPCAVSIVRVYLAVRKLSADGGSLAILVPLRESKKLSWEGIERISIIEIPFREFSELSISINGVPHWYRFDSDQVVGSTTLIEKLQHLTTMGRGEPIGLQSASYLSKAI